MKVAKMTRFAILGLLLVAGTVVFLPGLHASAVSGSSITAVVTRSGTTTTYTEGHGTTIYSSSCNGSTETYGNLTFSVMPCVAYGFPSAFVRNATLDTPQVLPFIKTAYEYHLVYFAHSATDNDVMYAVLNVTGSQVVTGNYSSGYQVSYVGNRLLNVTFLKVTFQHFAVMHVSAYTLPDRNDSIVYTPQQAQAISLALSDSRTESLTNTSRYYAEFVGPSGDSTTSSIYLVQFYQVDGTGIVGAIVNLGLNSVMNSFTQLRVSGECWPGGIVVTDPWGQTGFGCTT